MFLNAREFSQHHEAGITKARPVGITVDERPEQLSSEAILQPGRGRLLSQLLSAVPVRGQYQKADTKQDHTLLQDNYSGWQGCSQSLRICLYSSQGRALLAILMITVTSNPRPSPRALSQSFKADEPHTDPGAAALTWARAR